MRFFVWHVAFILVGLSFWNIQGTRWWLMAVSFFLALMLIVSSLEDIVDKQGKMEL